MILKDQTVSLFLLINKLVFEMMGFAGLFKRYDTKLQVSLALSFCFLPI